MIRLPGCGKYLLITSIVSENSRTRLLGKNEDWEELWGIKGKENMKRREEPMDY